MNLIAVLAYQIGSKPVLIIGMWGGYDVGNSVSDGHLRHLQSLVERIRAVIEAWEQVTVNIDHVGPSIYDAMAQNNTA